MVEFAQGGALDTYIDERKRVDEETRQLAALFDEVLKLPSISGITVPVECPLCGTESAMTPVRVHLIRQDVEDIKDFKAAESAPKSAIAQLSSSRREAALHLMTAGDLGDIVLEHLQPPHRIVGLGQQTDTVLKVESHPCPSTGATAQCASRRVRGALCRSAAARVE